MERREETIVLDSGAVIGLSRNDRNLRQIFRAAREDGAEFRVPMVVIAETVWGNGPRDAPVNLVLAQTSPQHPLSNEIARAAGRLLAKARSASTIDALVVAEAIECSPAVIYTSDSSDLRQLLDDHPGVTVESI